MSNVTTAPMESGVYLQGFNADTREVDVHVKWMRSWGPRSDSNAYDRRIYLEQGPGAKGWSDADFPGAVYEFLRDLPESEEGAA